jgi:hypothetical protein
MGLNRVSPDGIRGIRAPVPLPELIIGPSFFANALRASIRCAVSTAFSNSPNAPAAGWEFPKPSRPGTAVDSIIY